MCGRIGQYLPSSYLEKFFGELFGLMFINSGLNKFFNYIPVPADLPEKLVKTMNAFMEIGWLLPLVAVAEILGKTENMVKSYAFQSKNKKEPPESVLLDLKRCDRLLQMGKIEPGNKRAILFFLVYSD